MKHKYVVYYWKDSATDPPEDGDRLAERLRLGYVYAPDKETAAQKAIDTFAQSTSELVVKRLGRRRTARIY